MTTAEPKSWQFIDRAGTFALDDPQDSSYLYFPLVNEAGLMSAVSPTLQGDIKTGQNHFLMPPVSVEDLHNARGGRNFWVRLPDGGVWSAVGNSAPQFAARHEPDGERVSLEAGLLWHTLRRSTPQLGLAAEVTNFVPAGDAAAGDPVEVMLVTLSNQGDRPLYLTPTAAIPLYGRSADNLRDHRHVTSLLHRITTGRYGVSVCPTLSFDERGHHPNQVTYSVLGVEADGTPPQGFFPVLEDFSGEGGCLDWPAAVVQNLPATCGAGAHFEGYEAMGALRFGARELAPGESCSYVILMLITPGEPDVERLTAAYGGTAQAAAALERTRRAWQAKVAGLAVQTGDERFDGWMKWVTVQPVLRRLFGNSFLPHHDYGRGGRGWRDLWQDCLALLVMEPEKVSELLFQYYAGVRIDGSNATIIGTQPGEFLADRNNIPRVWMDHGAWPYLTTRLYLDQSGDLAFLLREQAYFKDRRCDRCRGIDADWQPEQGTQLRSAAGEVYQGSILEHILVQHLTAFFNAGEHNNLRLENADWNDGLDMAPNRGESVAFSALYASNLRDLSTLLPGLEKTGGATVELAEELFLLLDTLSEAVDYGSPAARQARLQAYFAACRHTLSGRTRRVPLADLAADLAAKAGWFYEHIRTQEWIHSREGQAWFNGYYDDDGCRVEGDHPLGVRMTLTGQVFTLMGGIATPEQAGQVLAAARKYLYDPRLGGYRLNTDFKEVRLNMGRCFGFAFGHKENGAMFSHMAVMFANALYRQGYAAAGWQVLEEIYQHCSNFPVSRIYPGIPEYINARGRGMYSYLTGSASWYLLTLLCEVFGVAGRLGDLALAPALLRRQFDAKGEARVRTLFAGRRLEVCYANPGGLEVGEYRVARIWIDGLDVAFQTDGRGAVLPREVIAGLDVEAEHYIRVELKRQ